jgi:nucleotide-binding universal stress UspA family protein
MNNKTIFVAHDFSLASKNALNIAAQIADNLDARLYVYNVIPVALLNDIENSYVFNPNEAIKKNNTLMRRMIASVRKSHKDLIIVFEVDYGLVIPKIQNKIAEINPWLTVVGVKRREVFDRVIFGDVCSDLVDLIEVPFMVVPANYSQLKLEQVVYAWDGQSSEVEYLHFLRKLLTNEGARFTALNVTHYDEKTQNLLPKFKINLKKYFYKHKTQVIQLMGLDKKQAINNALLKIKPDLLVVYAHRYNFFHKLVHASFTKKAIQFSKSPVLVIKELKA